MSTDPQARIVRKNEGVQYRQGPAVFKTDGIKEPGRFDFFVMDIEYCTGPGLHVHKEQDDTFYILKGVLAIQCYNKLHHLGPGDFATIPPGVPHTFDNIVKGQAPVKVVNIMTPGGYEGIFAENEYLDEHTPADEQRAINERYGVAYVGPPLRKTFGVDQGGRS